MTSMTGAELQKVRRKAGINQTDMGKLIGCSRHAVSYWETKLMIERKALRYGVPKRMCDALGIKILPNYSTLMRARGGGVLQQHKLHSTRAQGDGVLVWPLLQIGNRPH